MCSQVSEAFIVNMCRYAKFYSTDFAFLLYNFL